MTKGAVHVDPYTCVDVGRGARRSVPARRCRARTAVDRAPTLAARRTVIAVPATGDRSTRLLRAISQERAYPLERGVRHTKCDFPVSLRQPRTSPSLMTHWLPESASSTSVRHKRRYSETTVYSGIHERSEFIPL